MQSRLWLTQKDVLTIVDQRSPLTPHHHQSCPAYLIKSSICWSEDSERSGTSEVLHHASGLQGGVEGGEVLVLGDQGGHALPGLIDDSRGLGGGAGDGVDIWSAEVVSLVRSGRSDRQVVVEASDWSGVVGENSLGRQEWVEGLQTGVSSSRIIILMGSH